MPDPSKIAQYAKALCAAVVAACGVAGTALADGRIDSAEAVGVAATFFGALGAVAAVRNTLTTKQLLAQPNYLPATSIVSMPLGHPDAIKQALTVADDPGANRVRYFEGLNQRFEEAHPRGEGGKFRKKGTTA
jgi:hypothetical protein